MWSQSHGMYRDSRDGPWKPVPEPEVAVFKSGSSGGQISPCLSIELGRIGGYGYSGCTPMDKALKIVIKKRWFQPGDSAECSLESSMIATDAREEKTNKTEYRTAGQLVRLAERSQISLLARLPIQQPDPGSPDGMTVRDYLQRLMDSAAALQYKWRDRVLLLQFPGWFWEGDPAPWRTWLALAEAEKHGTGFMSVRTMCETAVKNSADQLNKLAVDFPVAAQIARFQPLLVVIARQANGAARITSESGIPLSGDLWQAASDVGIAVPNAETNRFKSIRITAIEAASGPTDQRDHRFREYTVELRDLSGAWSPWTGFTYESHEPTPPNQDAAHR
jgi:hypothetical protein